MMRRQLPLLGLGIVFVLAVLFLAPAGIAKAAEAAPQSDRTYTTDAPVVHVVQTGETLAAIATRYGTTTQVLMRQNSLRNPDKVYPGQRLIITSGSSDQTGASGIYVVRRGQTLGSIAKQSGVSVDALKEANGLRSETVFVGQRLRLPTGVAAAAGNANVYVVKPGDTLTSIAATYGLPVASLAKQNGIAPDSLVKVGQKLQVAGGASEPAARRGPKKIVVSISQQRCWRYEGTRLLNTWTCSTGRRGWGTSTGTFRVQSKLRKAFGSTWNIWMPYWLGIYWSGRVENGIHGLPWNAKTGHRTWAGLVGTKITYGCVMLNDSSMKTLWDWADIGTTVVIKR
jgi:LysM repeat protein